MKQLTIILVLLIAAITANAQYKLVLNNNVYLRMSDASMIVLENNSSDAITLKGTGGNIITESEVRCVKWIISDYTGSYTVPFTDYSGIKIPVTLNVTTAGSNGGYVSFTTYGGSSWDNLNYSPSDVTNLTSDCCANNSSHVIDRFWILDPAGYSAKPETNILFTYLDEEHQNDGNEINESSLFAQRFNSISEEWGDWLGTNSTANTTANTVSSGNITPANFYRSWTLVDHSFPLPVTLLNYKVECYNNNQRKIIWSTASETDNAKFFIELSYDAQNWRTIADVPSRNSNSVTLNNYSFNYALTSEDLKQPSLYFCLKQQDFNGVVTVLGIKTALCQQIPDIGFNASPNPCKGFFNLSFSHINTLDQLINLRLSDLFGKIISTKELKIDESNTAQQVDLSGIAPGVYNLTITCNSFTTTKKLVIQ